MSDTDHRYDLYSQSFKRSPHPTFAAMRRDHPIHAQAGLDGKTRIWFVTRYQDVERILRDHKRFVRDERNAVSPAQAYQPSPLEELLSNHMLNKDGEDHRRLRSLVSQAFTPKRVAELRPRVQAIAHGLLDGVAARGEMDLIADFAFPLPTIVILELLGVPTEDRDLFRAWSNALLEPAMDEASQHESVRLLTEFTDYLRALFNERRAQPREDMISALLQAEEAGDSLSEGELFSTTVLLIVAGHETTVNLIANAMLALFRNPEKRALLETDRSLMPSAVEEFVRYDGSVERALNRFAAEDVEVGGQTIRKGEPVILILSSANRDAETFTNPDDLDLSRHPNPHLGFGKGPHYCMGSPLARLESEIALDALLTRLPGVRLALDEAALRWRFLPGFRGLETLPVRWTVTAGS